MALAVAARIGVALAKNSTRNVVLATLCSVPLMVVPLLEVDTPVSTGNAWLSLALLALFRKIPRPLLEKMELPRMLLPVPESTSTPREAVEGDGVAGARDVPPIVLLLAPSISMPALRPSATVPVLSVPMRLPWMRLFVGASRCCR